MVMIKKTLSSFLVLSMIWGMHLLMTGSSAQAVNAASTETQGVRTVLAGWTFSSSMDFSQPIRPTYGMYDQFRFGGWGSIVSGIGSAEGQIYRNNWYSGLYWFIDSELSEAEFKKFDNFEISFGAHGSNTGPRNFELEMNYGYGWEVVGDYTLTTTRQRFNFSLPVGTSPISKLELRFRMANSDSIDGRTVTSAGTSRMYDIEIIGIDTVLQLCGRL